MLESTAEAVTGLAGVDAIAITDATPEAAVKGDVGSVAWDAANNTLYVKDTGAYTNTGWVDVAAAAKAAVIAELQAIVASAADFTELKTDIAAWTASP